MPRSLTPDLLRRRNALWERLRQAQEGSPEFEAALAELADLIRWPRERVLAGLGQHVSEAAPSED